MKRAAPNSKNNEKRRTQSFIIQDAGRTATPPIFPSAMARSRSTHHHHTIGHVNGATAMRESLKAAQAVPHHYDGATAAAAESATADRPPPTLPPVSVFEGEPQHHPSLFLGPRALPPSSFHDNRSNEPPMLQPPSMLKSDPETFPMSKSPPVKAGQSLPSPIGWFEFQPTGTHTPHDDPGSQYDATAMAAAADAAAAAVTSGNNGDMQEYLYSEMRNWASRCKTVSPSVPRFNGDKSSMQVDHFLFDPSRIDDYVASNPPPSDGVDLYEYILGVSDYASLLPPTVDVPLTEDQTITPKSIANMQVMINGLTSTVIHTRTNCEVCKCRPATTGLEIVGPCRPNEHPFTHCTICANIHNLPQGRRWLTDPAICRGGKNRYRSAGTLCEDCLRNRECKFPGCSSSGDTHPTLQLCGRHLNQYMRQMKSNRHAIQKCIRCRIALTGENRTTGNGSLNGMCNGRCSQLCAQQDESGKFICNLPRGSSCRCQMHDKEATSKWNREYHSRKKNNEPAICIGWSDKEVDMLRNIAPHHTKKWGKSIVFDTGAIASILAAAFPSAPPRTAEAVKLKLRKIQMKP
ncbi:hypothetical protein ACHAWC_010699 [Mediolabrus comicus]